MTTDWIQSDPQMNGRERYCGAVDHPSYTILRCYQNKTELTNVEQQHIT